MSIVQLDPTIPVDVVGRGKGYALGWIDYSSEHDLLWIVAINATGEVWITSNREIRMQTNMSMGRPPASASTPT